MAVTTALKPIVLTKEVQSSPTTERVAERESSNDRYETLHNIRPTGTELVPDQKWTTWRLRTQRPEMVAEIPRSFPDISKHRSDQAVQAAIYEANAVRAAKVRFKKQTLKQLRDHKPVHLAFRSMYDFYEEAAMLEAKRPSRSRLDNDDHDKIPGFWFDRMSFDLFARVWDFAANTFGHECFENRLQEWDWTRGLLQKLPKDFIRYASEVARGDPVIVPAPRTDPNNWEHLFLSKDSRVLLLVGVVAKILDHHVFGSLLFGATPGQKEALDNHDRETSNLADSYARNYPRSGTAKQFVLAGRTPTGYLPDLFSDNFWDEVDSVTMSILSLLLPLINFLGGLSPEAGWPPLTKVHQELHDIVAEAGWLTNGMRVSKSLFWVQFPNPGDLWDVDQEHATEIIWDKSKTAAENHDRMQLAGWKFDLADSWRAESEGQAIDREWKSEYEKRNPRPQEPRRAAKVQIALWPWIKQYSPVRPKSDGDLNSGELITKVMKAQIVYYAGDDSDEGERRERLTLVEHMRAANSSKTRDWAIWFLSWCIFLAVMYAVVITLYGRIAEIDSLSELFWESLESEFKTVTKKISVINTAVDMPLISKISTISTSKTSGPPTSTPVTVTNGTGDSDAWFKGAERGLRSVFSRLIW